MSISEKDLNRNSNPEQDLPENRNAKPTEEIIAFRRATCDSCSEKTALGLCGICHCIIHLKTMWKDQKCPIDKW